MLLPALLAVIGDRVDRWKLPWVTHGRERPDNAVGGFQYRLTYVVMRRPAVSLMVVVALLLVAAHLTWISERATSE